jgi:hypothetical protein
MTVNEKELLSSSELCDLFNYAACLPIGSAPSPVWPALQPHIVRNWTLRWRYQVESWSQARLRQALGLAIPRHIEVDKPGANLPHELVRWVPWRAA